MTNRTKRRLAAIALGTALAGLLPSAKAEAAVLDYGFTYSYEGQKQSGTFSLDTVTHTVTAFDFNLGGKQFGLSNIVSEFYQTRHPYYYISGKLNGFDVVENRMGDISGNDFLFDLSYDPALLNENLVLQTTSMTGRGYASDARFFYATTAPAVPEPATWALMIAGFGGIGLALRRRRAADARVSFVA